MMHHYSCTLYCSISSGRCTVSSGCHPRLHSVCDNTTKLDQYTHRPNTCMQYWSKNFKFLLIVTYIMIRCCMVKIHCVFKPTTCAWFLKLFCLGNQCECVYICVSAPWAIKDNKLHLIGRLMCKFSPSKCSVREICRSLALPKFCIIR